MALEESIDGMERLESNGIIAYVEPNLKEFIKQYGKITIDFIKNMFGNGGYTITIGNQNCSGGCGTC